MSDELVVLSHNEAMVLLNILEEQQQLISLLLDAYPAQTEIAREKMLATAAEIKRKTAGLKSRLRR